MPNAKTVVRDPDSKRRRILKAARRLLVKRGFQDIVLDDVAREAGVAKGTLFLYHRNKDELLAAALSDLVEGLGLELEVLAKTGLTGRPMLEAAAKVILLHFDHSRDFMAHIVGGRLPGCAGLAGEKMRERFRANHARVRVIIALASRDAGRSLADPDYASAAFIGLCRSATMRKILYGHRRPLVGEADRVVDFFLAGSGTSV